MRSALACLLSLTFPVGASAQSVNATPRGAALQRPAEGFSVSIPAGWIEKADADSAAMIVQLTQPEIQAMVFVQEEAAPTVVTDVLAKAAVRLKNDTTRTFISSSFGVVLDRPALIAVSEDKVARYKLTLLPRDEEDTSQVYYGIMTAAPRAAFANAEATLDRIVAGFRILPPSSSAAKPTGSTSARPVSPLPPTAATRTPAADRIDRAKVIERILAPGPKSPGL